jgi:hypothetical protein
MPTCNNSQAALAASLKEQAEAMHTVFQAPQVHKQCVNIEVAAESARNPAMINADTEEKWRIKCLSSSPTLTF